MVKSIPFVHLSTLYLDRHATINTHSIYIPGTKLLLLLKGMASIMASLQWAGCHGQNYFETGPYMEILILSHCYLSILVYKNNIDITVFMHALLQSIPYGDTVPFIQLCCGTCALYCNFFHSVKISGICGQCEGCESQNCGQCTFCIDMTRFGGPGLKKKAFIHRKCRQKVSALQLTQA